MHNNIYEKIKEFIKTNGFFIISLLLILFITFYKLPYEVEMPGGLIDLQNRVKINGEGVPIAGTFNMAYVSSVRGSIPYILIGLINPDWDVIKESDTKYDNETVEEAYKRDKLELEQSKNLAIIAAMKEANIEYTLEDKANNVIYKTEESDTDLRIGDNILRVDGEEVMDVEEIKKVIKSKKAGDIINVDIIRDGKEMTVTAKVYEKNDTKYIGISIITQVKIISDTTVDIETKSSESGPSGGMMMALITYNALTKQDLTKGKTIVGTGTINMNGDVGEIGGIKYKVMGAAKSKADIMLVPEENYEEAISVKNEKGYDLEIVSISTLRDAIEYLERKDS